MHIETESAARPRLDPALLSLGLGPAVALGMGRFGYGMLLPSMQADLGWSYVQSGLINTANAIGYLGGALLTSAVLRRMSPANAFGAGLAVVVFSLLLTVLVRDFTVLLALRLLAGLAGGVVFVSGGVLVSGAEAARHRRGFYLGAYYAGAGSGLLLAGLALPQIMALDFPQSWPWGWAAMGALSAPLAIFAAIQARRIDPHPQGDTGGGRFDLRSNAGILAGYMLYGTGSIGYMTFVTAWLSNSADDGWRVSIFWTTFALAALLAPWLWQGLLDRWRAGWAFLALVGLNGLGSLLPLLPFGLVAVLASALVCGATFFAIVAVTTMHVRRAAGAADRARAIGLFAVIFGLGQAIGPVLTGAVADVTGQLGAGLLLSGVLIVGGALLGAGARTRAAKQT